jgi:hypothetical protein
VARLKARANANSESYPGEVNGTTRFPAHSDEETTFHA